MRSALLSIILHNAQQGMHDEMAAMYTGIADAAGAEQL